ncbi:MAG: hypothetical protein ABSF26_08560 [Thermoguttaceae bacterium]|jgi:hypothetical protein
MSAVTRTTAIVLGVVLVLLCAAGPAKAVIVGVIFEDQQNKWPATSSGADGYHLSGQLEDSFQTPVYVSQFNGQIQAPGGPIILPPNGNTFYNFGCTITLVPRPSSLETLGATAGLSSSAENTVGQANRGTRQFRSVGRLGSGPDGR